MAILITDLKEAEKIKSFCTLTEDGYYYSALCGTTYDLSHVVWPKPKRQRAKRRQVIIIDTDVVEALPIPATTKVAYRERVILSDGSALIHLPGGDIEESEWHNMTHTVKDKPRHKRPEPQRTERPTRYHAGEGKYGRPVILLGKHIIERGFKSRRERDNRLAFLIEAEQAL